jgi:hypothetical protein
MDKNYEEIEINLDQETENSLVELEVSGFSGASQSVYRDILATGEDMRIAFYNAWRNEQIVKALELAVAKHEFNTVNNGENDE